MSKPTVYCLMVGPPTRALLMAVKELNIEVELKHVSITKEEHIKPEFLKLNPGHTLPVLVDGDNVICDSHAAMAYLVDKYGESDQLYPKDIYQRAMVNSKLFFEALLFERHRTIIFPILYRGRSYVPDERKEMVEQAYEQLEAQFGYNLYMVGNNLTIADFSFIATMPSLRFFHQIDDKKYPKLLAWIKRVEKLPYYDEINRKGSDDLIMVVKNQMEANKDKEQK